MEAKIIDKERLRTILLRCIGDMRECPECRHAFVPEDMAQKDAWKFYNDTFGMPAANKFERRAFEKIDEEALHEISRPGKIMAVPPPPETAFITWAKELYQLWYKLHGIEVQP